MSEFTRLPEICNVCGQQGRVRCINCDYVWYCTPACEIHDRIAHEEVCSMLSGQFSDNPPQQFSHSPVSPASHISSHSPLPADIKCIEALVLPVNSTKSYYTTVRLHGTLSPTGTMRWDPQLDGLIEGTTFPFSAVSITGVGERPLRFPLKLFFEMPFNYMSQASVAPTNECAHTLAPEKRHSWRGNILILSFSGSRREGYRDMKASDWSSVVYFLQCYNLAM